MIRPECTGKTGFLTWDAAKKAMNRSRFKTHGSRGPVMVYKCRTCGFYHFGSSSFRKTY